MMHHIYKMTREGRDLRQTSTFTETIYQHIKKSIHKGDLKPNQRITVQEFTKYFNVSITPVREAFQRLMAEKYIAIYSRSNIKVIGLSVEEVQQIFELNAIMDKWGMTHNLKDFSDRLINELKKMHGKLETLFKGEKNYLYFRYNMKIHERIWKAYNNDMVYQTLVNANSRISLFMENFAEKYYPGKAVKKTFKDHCDLIKCIEKRDAEKAVKILSSHWNVITYD